MVGGGIKESLDIIGRLGEGNMRANKVMAGILVEVEQWDEGIRSAWCTFVVMVS